MAPGRRHAGEAGGAGPRAERALDWRNMALFPRVSQLALLAATLLGLALPAQSQQTNAAPASAAADPRAADKAWLYIGSDVPPDPAWKFGVLSNGVRYAVRNNGVPPGQVSIRVRIDAGSLMEQDSERGFAHLLEHLSFRGSEHVPDGESKRIWQRLGVTFGSDSNAQTTFTQTVYKLDLPNADQAGLDESMKILAGMMERPAITKAALDAERPVVLAEQREQPGPQVRMQDASLALMFAGQPLAERSPIGTVETLTGATAESVQAFHQRWYRPERAVVIAVGDFDPAALEQLVVKHFSDWKGTGPAPAKPDFGTPAAGHPTSASLVEPTLPAIVSYTVLRPWTVFEDTIVFNQKRLVDLIALRLINRRLETRARSGGSYISAQADLEDVSRSANVTTVQILPVGGEWETALKDVRGVIAELAAKPPTKAEIDREIAEVDAGMRHSIDIAPVTAGALIADNLVEAVDINETVTTPEGSYGIFRGAVDKGMFSPEAVQASAKRIFEGVAMRAMVAVPEPDDNLEPKLAAALDANVTSAASRNRSVGTVSFSRLPALGKPAKVVTRETVLDGPKIEKVVFSNGVNLLMRENDSEVAKVYVRVRFGGGMNALPADRESPIWAAQFALIASGVGPLDQEALDALTGDRQIGMDFAIDDDAFVLGATTTKADLPDQLKLLATKLAAPRWDPNPVTRARAVMLAGYASLASSPSAVLGSQLEAQLHSNDPRWGMPSREVIAAVTPASFRALWEPLLATGPIEIEIFGDHDSEATIAAVASTFGALKPRKAETRPAPPVRFPAHVTTPVVLKHTGQENQAAAVIAWPTGGGSDGIAESRKLEILAAVFRDRLIDQLRSQAGISYSPNVGSDWPLGLANGGKILALGMLPPDKTDFFFTLARGIAADLAARPIEQDELDRALTPLKQMVIRRSSGNMFWLSLAQGGAYDPKRIAAISTLGPDYGRTSPAELQALAAKYLDPAKDWTMVVLPEKMSAAPPEPVTARAPAPAPAARAPAPAPVGR